MIDAAPMSRPHPLMWLLWFMLFVGVPATVGHWETRGPTVDASGPTLGQTARITHAAAPPPAVQPVELYELDRDQARAFNSAIPFSRLPSPAARPFVFSGTPIDQARAIDCLAAAQLYEAGDDVVGERAVAQVVLNRVRHPAFPKTVCGVVFQGQERSTGCQFTFTCDGALARSPTQVAWNRARDIARAALAGQVFKPVGYATHYHTDWVVPYWSSSLDKIATVDTHLFFRWRGWWGTPPAFRVSRAEGEPVIARIARLSAAHQGEGVLIAGLPPMLLPGGGVAALVAKPQQSIGAESVGQMMAGARLITIAPGAKSFLVELSRDSQPDIWPTMAQKFCAGRPECRIMAWRAGSAPGGLPLTSEQLEGMTFAYIHNAATGLQRSLWNCAQSPRANAGECMRQRNPAQEQTGNPATKVIVPTLGGVWRKDRFETVKIVPPAPVVAQKNVPTQQAP